MAADVMQLRAEATRDFAISELSKKSNTQPHQLPIIHPEAQKAREGVKVALINSLPFSSSTTLSACLFKDLRCWLQVTILTTVCQWGRGINAQFAIMVLTAPDLG